MSLQTFGSTIGHKKAPYGISSAHVKTGFCIAGTFVLAYGFIVLADRCMNRWKSWMRPLLSKTPRWNLKTEGEARIQVVRGRSLDKEVTYIDLPLIRHLVWDGYYSLKNVYERLSLGRLRIPEPHDQSVVDLVLPWEKFPKDMSDDEIHEEISALLFEETGLTQTDYDHLIIYLPDNYTDNWTGLGTLGQRHALHRDFEHGKIWLVSPSLGTLLHEFGHNLGLDHATCHFLPVNNPEYGDPTSFMGDTVNSTQLGNFIGLNAPNLSHLGWLHPHVVMDSGSYLLHPFNRVYEPTDEEILPDSGHAALRLNYKHHQYYLSLVTIESFYHLAIYYLEKDHSYRTRLVALLKPSEEYLLQYHPDGKITYEGYIHELQKGQIRIEGRSFEENQEKEKIEEITESAVPEED